MHETARVTISSVPERELHDFVIRAKCVRIKSNAASIGSVRC